MPHDWLGADIFGLFVPEQTLSRTVSVLSQLNIGIGASSEIRSEQHTRGTSGLQKPLKTSWKTHQGWKKHASNYTEQTNKCNMQQFQRFY
jgi:invasion protein IalB